MLSVVLNSTAAFTFATVMQGQAGLLHLPGACEARGSQEACGQGGSIAFSSTRWCLPGRSAYRVRLTVQLRIRTHTKSKSPVKIIVFEHRDPWDLLSVSEPTELAGSGPRLRLRSGRSVPSACRVADQAEKARMNAVRSAAGFSQKKLISKPGGQVFPLRRIGHRRALSMASLSLGPLFEQGPC